MRASTEGGHERDDYQVTVRVLVRHKQTPSEAAETVIDTLARAGLRLMPGKTWESRLINLKRQR